MQAVVFFLILLILWIGFSGKLTALSLIVGTGAIASTIILLVKFFPKKHKSHFSYIKFISYLPYLLKEIALSSLKVTLQIWQKNPNISPSFAYIKSSINNDLGNSIYALSITVTPGTIAVLVDKDQILVHGLSKENIESLDIQIMHNKVKNIIQG